jgi:hypothetical protein
MLLVATGVGCLGACARSPAPLTELLEARRLASDLQVQFSKAADAANLAVMSDTDAASASAADDARRARRLVEQDIEALQPLLVSLRYSDDQRLLDGFKARFAAYRRLDDEILPLAVENTNLKAQRLSFGDAQQAAGAFRAAIEATAGSSRDTNSQRAEALAARALVSLLDIQVLQAPHIAESDAAAMTRMEGQMAASEAAARKAIAGLRAALPDDPGGQLAAALAALDRFTAINREIVTLSRRNSNVRSLALSLGEKRVATSACDDQLRTLETALAKHEFAATR